MRMSILSDPLQDWVLYRNVNVSDPLLDWVLYRCNGPGVVQRKDRQKKEFHDQSDYR